MESEARRRSSGPPSAPLRRLTRPSNGMPKTQIPASEGDRWQAMNAGETGRMPADRGEAALRQVLFGEQRDGGQRAADALDPVVDGDHAHLGDRLAAHPEGFVEHRPDLLF